MRRSEQQQASRDPPGGPPPAAPRPQQEQQPTDGVWDVAVIGAGCVGAAIALAVSRLDGVSCVVLESAQDVCQGASKANSGIVHGGYDAKPGTHKAGLGVRGNRLFPALCRELEVPLNVCGSLLLSFTERDDQRLDALERNAKANGVAVERWDAERVLRDQPHVSAGVRGALYCERAGVVSPYVFTIAMAEAAALNGVRFVLGRQVLAVKRAHQGGAGYAISVAVDGERGTRQTVTARRVVNAAGMGVDEIAAPFDYLTSFQIKPRRGDYVVLSKTQGLMVSRVLFQAPTERYGKGVLVARTIDGNLLLGPSSTMQESRKDKGTELRELAYVAWAARRSVPHLDTRESLRSFAGVRAKSTTGDFIIEARDGYVLLAGIESPGLTASPAIAEYVVELLGLASAPRKLEFKRRSAYALAGAPLAEDARVGHPDPARNVVCQCESVVESTVVDAAHRSPRPVSTDGIKWRTRCGMGECQAARCRGRVEALLDRELGAPRPELKPSAGERVERARLARL